MQYDLSEIGVMKFFRRRHSLHTPVVFLGDSITWEWARYAPEIFGESYINRGIPGITTGDMVERFDCDALQLKPRSIHVMGGTNDLWHTPVALAPTTIVKNIRELMVAARRADIRTYLASVPPIDPIVAPSGTIWGPMIQPVNLELRALAKEFGATFIDYAAVLGSRGILKQRFSADGVHLTGPAYEAMGRLIYHARP